MAFASFEFPVFCLLSVILLRLVPLGIFHEIVVALLSAFFVSTFANSPLELLPLAVFVSLGYTSLFVAKRTGAGAALGALITTTVLVFGWLRHYSLLNFVPHLPLPYVVVGLSYILFRVLQLIIDVGDDILEIPSPLRYFGYLFFFLSFVSGPIQRYQDYKDQLKRRVQLDGAGFHTALGRILLGYLMVAVLAVFTAKLLEKSEPQFYLAMFDHRDHHALLLYLVTTVTYFVHLYFNFAGYMHIVIGVGLIAGFELPENFNMPLLSSNFIDLWSRWHITLGNWFKLYCFNPLVKYLSASFPSPRLTPYLGAVAYFITFFLLGIWHGSTRPFVICGLLLGAGATINKLWQVFLVARLGRSAYKSLRDRLCYILLARGLTLGYFIVALTTVWIDDSRLCLLASGQGVAIILATLSMLVLAIAAAIRFLDITLAFLARLHPACMFRSEWAMGVWSGAMIFVLLYTIVQLGAGAPDFIYKGF